MLCKYLFLKRENPFEVCTIWLDKLQVHNIQLNLKENYKKMLIGDQNQWSISFGSQKYQTIIFIQNWQYSIEAYRYHGN